LFVIVPLVLILGRVPRVGYSRRSCFVGLDGNQVVVYGVPGGVLGWIRR
jgi:hypothetical protein